MRKAPLAVFTAAVLMLTACSSSSDNSPSNQASNPPAPAKSTTVTVITHDSFAVPDEVLAEFEQTSGLKVEFLAPGDAGSLVSQLVLTKDNPLGDVVYGIDNAFASKAVEAGVFAPYSSTVPAATDAATYSYPGTEGLTAIDYSDVCLNIDTAYFVNTGIAAPATLDDLLKEEYKGLTAVTNPATSSPGLSFALATVAAYGDDWKDYWTALRANGLLVSGSWSDIYFAAFSAPNYGGDYPIVLSYASSPPSEVIDGEPTTVALLDTCFRQVEYAGVLSGAKNPEAAGQVIDWLLSDAFQSSVPENMYVYPVSTTATIPAEWEQYAPLSENPWHLDPTEINAIRDDVIREWTATVVE